MKLNTYIHTYIIFLQYFYCANKLNVLDSLTNLVIFKNNLQLK